MVILSIFYRHNWGFELLTVAPLTQRANRAMMIMDITTVIAGLCRQRGVTPPYKNSQERCVQGRGYPFLHIRIKVKT
jgi:hypothetical protein